MRTSRLFIALLILLNVSLYCYHYILDNKVQDYIDIFQEYSMSIINGDTDINTFQCLYNRRSNVSLLKNYIPNIKDYQSLKNSYEYYVEGISMGQSRNVGISTVRCFHVSQRAYNYNIDQQVIREFQEVKSWMLIGPQGMYLHKPSIKILDDGSKGYCNTALINTDHIEYHLDVEIEGELKKIHYGNTTTIHNSSIQNGMITITVFDPCDEGNRKVFRLRV